MTQLYQRPLPLLTDNNRFYWTSGADGVLRMLRCQDCGYWLHPPRPVCPECLGRNLSPTATSGKGEIFSFTLNYKSWGAGLETPYAIIIVRLDEQPALQMTSGIIGVVPEEVRIGMRVSVAFEQDEDIWLPMFRPDTPAMAS